MTGGNRGIFTFLDSLSHRTNVLKHVTNEILLFFDKLIITNVQNKFLYKNLKIIIFRADPFDFGASQLKVPVKLLKKFIDKNLVTVSPCGAAFVKSSVRSGILPRMLNEILNTRLMVKKSMKMHKTNSILQRVLHSRQLGLKLIANVTYGYTAANFSGRMPCVEIGDSVVSKGRETLERAIKTVEENKRWGAKVVYGDTDSLFVLCPG